MNVTEPTPSEATPSETASFPATPSGATPSKATPSEATPSPAAPSEPTSSAAVLEQRLARLEDRVDRLLDVLDATPPRANPGATSLGGTADSPHETDAPRQDDAAPRLELHRLRDADRPAGRSSAGPAAPTGAPGSSSTSPAGGASTSADDPLFALHALEERYPSPGAVLYTGSVDLPLGPVQHQWGRTTADILHADWAERAERAGALGHPLRLALLRLLLEGEHTVAQLVDELELGSTGVAYHHLNQLHTSGWITSPRRGVWTIPPSRVVPLLAIVIALEEN